MTDFQSPMSYPTGGTQHSFVERIVGVFKLDRSIFDEVRREVGAMNQAAMIVAVTGFATSFGSSFRSEMTTFTVNDSVYHIGGSSWATAIVSGVLGIVISLIGWVIGSMIYRFVAVRLLGSPESGIQWQEVARPIGFGAAPSALALLTPIPILGAIGSLVGTIWGLAAQIVALSETFRVSKLRAFGIIFVSGIVVAIILIPLVCVLILIAAALVG